MLDQYSQQICWHLAIGLTYGVKISQVLIRVRPLNNMERSNNGYNRCLKQESAQSITWIGQPETKFTFDHVACETVDQVWLGKELLSVHCLTPFCN